MRPSRTALAVAMAVVAGACSNGQSRPVPEIPGDVAETSTAAVESTSSTPSSTTSTTTTTTATATSTTLDPAALIVAEQFSGVNFPAASLPTEAGSINNNRSPADTEEDRALIDAFSEVVTVFMEVQQAPSDTAAYETAPFTDEIRDRAIEAASVRAAANQVLDISEGLTLRPYVVEQDDPTIGLVYDCPINAAVWRDADSGEAAEPSNGWPQVGAPGVESGTGYLFELVEDRWVFSASWSEPGACG